MEISIRIQLVENMQTDSKQLLTLYRIFWYIKRLKAIEQRTDCLGRSPKAYYDAAGSKIQYNFADPDLREIAGSTTKSFQQSSNCRAAVDAKDQIVIASDFANNTKNKLQLKS